ncbi:MAG: histidinol-phosphate transaminase [Deinococcota bacterium]
MTVRPEIRALAPYHFKAFDQPIKLDQNESPYDLPDALKDAISTRVRELAFNRYPEIIGQSLRQKIADYHDWPEAGVMVSGGSNKLIRTFVEVCGVGESMLTVAPTFSVYALQAPILGARLLEIPLNDDFSLPMEALLEALSKDRGVFFLANPAAPTGNLFDRRDVEILVEAAYPNWTVVIDEAYYQFSETDFSDLAKRYDHVASLRTFSKAFALGGVRLGYTLTSPKLAEQLEKARMPFAMSVLQLAAGHCVLDAPDYIQTYINEVKTERPKVRQALAELDGIQVEPSVTNFMIFKVSDPARYYHGLMDRGVLIRRQDHIPGLDGYLRVSLGTPAENDAFIDAIQHVHAEVGTQKAQQVTTSGNSHAVGLDVPEGGHSLDDDSSEKAVDKEVIL